MDTACGTHRLKEGLFFRFVSVLSETKEEKKKPRTAYQHHDTVFSVEKKMFGKMKEIKRKRYLNIRASFFYRTEGGGADSGNLEVYFFFQFFSKKFFALPPAPPGAKRSDIVEKKKKNKTKKKENKKQLSQPAFLPCLSRPHTFFT